MVGSAPAAPPGREAWTAQARCKQARAAFPIPRPLLCSPIRPPACPPAAPTLGVDDEYLGGGHPHGQVADLVGGAVAKPGVEGVELCARRRGRGGWARTACRSFSTPGRKGALQSPTKAGKPAGCRQGCAWRTSSAGGRTGGEERPDVLQAADLELVRPAAGGAAQGKQRVSSAVDTCRAQRPQGTPRRMGPPESASKAHAGWRACAQQAPVLRWAAPAQAARRRTAV